MKQTKLKPWVRWMYLACSVIWLVNLVVRLSNYFRRLGRGVPPEQLAQARLDCIIAGLIVVLWLVAFFAWRMDQKKPAAWLVRLVLMAAVTAAWVATHPLAAAGGYPPFFWWTILAVLAGVTLYGAWRYIDLKRKMRSSEKDEII